MSQVKVISQLKTIPLLRIVKVIPPRYTGNAAWFQLQKALINGKWQIIKTNLATKEEALEFAKDYIKHSDIQAETGA